jgi:hypothetical protein
MPKDNKLITDENWSRWAMEKEGFSWTVDIEEKTPTVVSKSHRVRGVCPECKEFVQDGSECDNLSDTEVLRDYRAGRLKELVFDPTPVDRD